MEYRGSKSNNHARIGVKYCAAGFRNLFAGEFQPAPSAMRESGDRNVNTMNGWRRERDSNPRYGVNPYNALAGRPLRPLGHLSGRAAHYITRVRASFPASGRLIEFECLVQGPHGELHVFFVDDDRYLDLRGGDHLDVDALFGESAEHLACDSRVGTHADAHHRDLADPVVAANVGGFDVVLDLRLSTSSAFWYSLRCTVNDKSVRPSTPAFCMIMSTSMLASPIGPRMAYAIPGRSGTPMTVIFASSRLKAIPEMTASSIFASSSNVISVPSPCSWKLESTRRGTLFLPATSTDRICRIFEPRLAISSISSKVTDLSLRASGTMRGSVV